MIKMQLMRLTIGRPICPFTFWMKPGNSQTLQYPCLCLSSKRFKRERNIHCFRWCLCNKWHLGWWFCSHDSAAPLYRQQLAFGHVLQACKKFNVIHLESYFKKIKLKQMLCTKLHKWLIKARPVGVLDKTRD